MQGYGARRYHLNTRRRNISKKEMSSEEKRSVCESISYRKKRVEVLERRIEMCSRKESVLLQITKKEEALNPVNTNFIRKQDGEDLRRVSKTSASRVF